jgi:hypothetical protein
MKTIKLFCTVSMLLISGLSVNAQYILSITASPANPTTNDIITIYAEVAYPSASCDEHSQSHFLNGNTISANTLHCVGPMTVICNDTDTFSIGALPAGTYNFILQADAGWGPAPCTPGFVPGPSDTLTFVVTVASGIEDANSEKETFVYPNPAKDFIEISFKGTEALVEISSLSGQLIQSEIRQSNAQGRQNYDVSKLAAGTYIITIKTDRELSVNKFIKE